MEKNAIPAGQTITIEAKTKQKKNSTSMVKRFFTKANKNPFNLVTWKKFDVTVRNNDGSAIDRKLEFPEFWSESAVQITGAKYFRGRIKSDDWETSLKQVISRVVKQIKTWGINFGHLKNQKEANIFADELTHVLLHQKAAFNSPVWFNLGIRKDPQCSACFILDIEDTMESILEWIGEEGMIFKGGSGAGINLSPLRSSFETLTNGGHSSGPVSFMRGADSVAGMIASGGSTRRAAKMVVLNIEHPDSPKFIRAKAEEEKKVRALIDSGYNMYDLNDPAWNSIQYQNANNSIRVTDTFMRAVENDGDFSTRFVTTGKVAETFKARDLFKSIAQAAWECGDPGVQFDTTTNKWHTCPNSGRINASNPCSEFMFVDNSACNLASINLLRYLRPDNTFDTDAFIHTIDVLTMAQEIIVDGSSYPTEKITENSKKFRPLGLGYANLGALVMSLGLPYDSEGARHSAAAITALMTGEAYRFSAMLAKRVGAFEDFSKNKTPFMKVMGMHRNALYSIAQNQIFDKNIFNSASSAWDQAIAFGEKNGYRNAQVTLLAPTGTISFMMDCATTGIEPEFALVKTKMLVGGGVMKFVNPIVARALEVLGYDEEETKLIVEYIEERGTIEGAPELNEKDLAVFDCAAKPQTGTRAIAWQGHVKMVGAVQSFLSGAVSKTFNMSSEATVDDIMKAYMMGWKLGLKAFAVYRDGSKAAQPLLTSSGRVGKKEEGPRRKRLPNTRVSETHKFSIVGHEGFLTYSSYEEGGLAEIFIRMSKQGSTLAGLLDAFALSCSIALQYGVPLKKLVKKFSYSRYEPAGYTGNPDIRIATSITDYVFRYLAMKFLGSDELTEVGIADPRQDESEESTGQVAEINLIEEKSSVTVETETVIFADTVCKECGGMMIQTGTCKTCMKCGTSNGGCQ